MREPHFVMEDLTEVPFSKAPTEKLRNVAEGKQIALHSGDLPPDPEFRSLYARMILSERS